MSLLWSIIVGGIIGWIAGAIMGKNIPGGIFGNIVAGFIGAWLGSWILGNWGPMIGNFYIFPALVGAIVLVFIISLVMGSRRKSRKS